MQQARPTGGRRVLTREAGTQLLALGGHTHGAVVGVANARHDAAGGNHGNLREASGAGCQNTTSRKHQRSHSAGPRSRLLWQSSCWPVLIRVTHSAEAVLVGAQGGGDQHVTAVAHAAVAAQRHALAQAVGGQGLKEGGEGGARAG